MAKWKEIRKSLALTPLHVEELGITFQLRAPSTGTAFKLGGKGEQALDAIRELVMECVMDEDGSPVFDTVQEVDEIPITAYKPIVDGVMALLGDTVKVGSEQVDADILAAKYGEQDKPSKPVIEPVTGAAGIIKDDVAGVGVGVAGDSAGEGEGDSPNASSGEVDTLSAKLTH